VFDSDPGFALPAYDTVPLWHAMVDSYANGTIILEVETTAEGILVLSETYYPGWTAVVDGIRTDVHRVDGCLRGIRLPAGRHTVSVRFEPASFSRGMILTLVTLGVCGAGFALSWRRHRTGADR